MGIQEIDDDDESQDIFDDFDKNLKQKMVTFNEYNNDEKNQNDGYQMF